MKQWVGYALLSMTFAGVTSVIAKLGLTGISAELGLTVRTAMVFLLVMGFAVFAVPTSEIAALSRQNIFWLGLSSVATTLSWIFYYKALKDGEVSKIALIDKGSVIVAVLLAFIILKEQITPRTLIGATLMLGGILVLIRK